MRLLLFRSLLHGRQHPQPQLKLSIESRDLPSDQGLKLVPIDHQGQCEVATVVEVTRFLMVVDVVDAPDFGAIVVVAD